MVKTFPKHRVRETLRGFGFKPVSKGNGTAREVWQDRAGRRCQASLCKNDIPYSFLYTLGGELEAKQVCTRAAFLKAVKGR